MTYREKETDLHLSRVETWLVEVPAEGRPYRGTASGSASRRQDTLVGQPVDTAAAVAVGEGDLQDNGRREWPASGWFLVTFDTQSDNLVACVVATMACGDLMSRCQRVRVL